MKTRVDTIALTDTIKARILEIGFDKVAITRADTPPKAEHLHRWLNNNFHGEMAYMEQSKEKRIDPKKYIPNAKTIICVALNYYTEGAEPNSMQGRISRYARGTDYHNIMSEKLKVLCDFIKEETGTDAKPCVDTNPVLEKLWAQNAGIGWQGKHSNIITRDLSSWIFIGEIITDLELEYDEPFVKDLCGTCTKCIDLCPTKAIVAPYVVDSRLCISYLTIEYHGIIPQELRPLMGNHIFGCDICQDVCPWNKFAKVTREENFFPNGTTDITDLTSLAEMTREDFNKRFRNSPIKRAKYAGFLRNVAVALGNSKSIEAIKPLEKLLHHNEPLVRLHVVWALDNLLLALDKNPSTL